MKSFFGLIVVLLIGLPAFAQDHGPVFPWPLSSSLRPVNEAGLVGGWVSYANGFAWFVEIRKTSENDVYSIRVQSHSIPKKSAYGWFHKDGLVYLGSLSVDKTAGIMGALLYEDSEGLKLRISTNPQHFLDLRLYRTE
jgi:hypothetical protein